MGMRQLNPASLSWVDWAFVGRVVVLLPPVEFMLKRRGLKQSYATLARWGGEPGRTAATLDDPAERAAHLGSLFDLANRRYSFHEATCLPASLLLWWLLRRRGIAADLCIGARTLTGEFEAHAWVEFEGVVLNDDQEVRDIYFPFDLRALSSKVTRP